MGSDPATTIGNTDAQREILHRSKQNKITIPVKTYESSNRK